MKDARSLLILLVVPLLFIFSGCIASAWKQAQVSNTPDAYRRFLQEYPDSKFSKQAEDAIEELDWRETEKVNTVLRYKAYLGRYPISRHRAEAQEGIDKIDKIAWTEAESQGTVSAYEKYLRDHPDGKFKKKAHDALECIEWEKIENEWERIEKIGRYCEFLNQNSTSRFAGEARTNIEKFWGELRRLNDLDSYRSFMSHCSKTEFFNRAKSVVAEFEKLENAILQIIATGPGDRFRVNGVHSIGTWVGNVLVVDGQYESGTSHLIRTTETAHREIEETFLVTPFASGSVYQFVGETNLSKLFKDFSTGGSRRYICLGAKAHCMDFSSWLRIEELEYYARNKSARRSRNRLTRELNGYTVVGEGQDREVLSFAIIDNVGFVYLSGKGHVITPGGKRINLGHDN